MDRFKQRYWDIRTNFVFGDIFVGMRSQISGLVYTDVVSKTQGPITRFLMSNLVGSIQNSVI
jgi:hypothetical protein